MRDIIRLMRMASLALMALVAAAPAIPAAAAQAGDFTLINGTSGQLTSVAIRPVGGGAWRPLVAAASPGGRSTVRFSSSDCAFDIRAGLAGATIVWPAVNLCEVKSVTLNRNASGAVWADYD